MAKSVSMVAKRHKGEAGPLARTDVHDNPDPAIRLTKCHGERVEPCPVIHPSTELALSSVIHRQAQDDSFSSGYKDIAGSEDNLRYRGVYGILKLLRSTLLV
ncbi:MAG: hypothetical protein JSU90_11180 [Nitrospiraceae bacterium]|nr:MAG: hypothetical protein JSU90_11180 [Nitrospiraceae bacterium]